MSKNSACGGYLSRAIIRPIFFLWQGDSEIFHELYFGMILSKTHCRSNIGISI
jgi:hypothetical protein